MNSTIRGGKRSRLHRGERPSVTWNQSVMELGAVICTAKSPLVATPARLRTTVHFSRPAPRTGSAAPAHANDSKARIDSCAVWCSPRCASFPLEPRCSGEDADKLWKDQIQLAACIASLDDDGLIEILDGGLRLPADIVKNGWAPQSVYGRGDRRLEELWRCRGTHQARERQRGAGTGANGPIRQASQNNRSGKLRKAQDQQKQQAIYRRRRIVAGTVLLLIIALIVFLRVQPSAGVSVP